MMGDANPHHPVCAAKQRQMQDEICMCVAVALDEARVELGRLKALLTKVQERAEANGDRALANYLRIELEKDSA